MQTPERMAKLQRLEALLAQVSVRPADLMRALREFGETHGKHLHELTDAQLDRQIADVEASIERNAGRQSGKAG